MFAEENKKKAEADKILAETTKKPADKLVGKKRNKTIDDPDSESDDEEDEDE